MEEPTSVAVLEPKKKSRKKLFMTFLFIIVNVVVIGYTAIVEFSKEHPDSMGIKFGILNILCLICAFLCLGVVLMMETLKYLIMMRSLGEKISLKHAFQVAALGKYYDSITPSGAGGQPFQIWYLSSSGYSQGASAAMPLSGFLTMQGGFVILAFVVFIFNNNAIEATAIKISAYIGLLFYMLVPALIILFAISPKSAGRVIMFFVRIGACMHLVKNPFKTGRKIMHALNDYRRSIVAMLKERFLLLKLLGLSIVYQMALCSIPYFVIHTFGGTLTFFNVFSVCVFIYAAITYIPTPGNAGAAEGSFYALFSPLGANCLFWAMLIWRFICYYSFLIIGVLIYGYNALTEKHKNKGVRQND